MTFEAVRGVAERRESTMAARRKKRADGRYVVTFRHEGKRYPFYGKTQAEAKAKADAARDRLKTGGPVRDATRTLGSFMDQWVETTLAASTRAQSTKNLHAMFVRNWINPTIGSIPLNRLKPADVTRLMLVTKESGLADASRRKCLDVLNLALDDAVDNGLLSVNPARKVKRPVPRRKEARYLDPEEIEAFLIGAKGPRSENALRLILSTGLRRGEALALRWKDVDLERAEMRVNGSLVRVPTKGLIITSTKTPGSRRTISLSTAAVALLKKIKASQAAEKLKAANLWNDDTGLVFTTECGNPVDPRNLNRSVSIVAQKAGLEGVNVHTLRHTYASTALLNGVPLKVVSTAMGHSTITLTADIYGHVTDAAARAAAETVSDALGF